MAKTRSSTPRPRRGTRAPRSTAAFAFVAWPTESRIITQHFGARPLYYAQYGLAGHEGIDFDAPNGTSIFCVAQGTVHAVFPDDGQHPYGCHVRVNHPGGYQTIYAHLQEAHVQQGEAVQAGQRLGLAGETGNTDGPHLHLTLKLEGTTLAGYPNNIIDPTPFVNALMSPNTDDAQYVRDTVPDGSVIPAAHTFDQTWFLRNSGSTTWNGGYTLAWIGGPQLDAPPAVALPQTPPGAVVPITIGFRAPTAPGKHRSVWQPRDPNGRLFGDPVWVEISVPESTPSPVEAPGGFVGRRGRDLVWQGRPLRFVGANLRGLIHYGARASDPLQHSRPEHRESQLREARRMGVRVARIFLADKDATVDEIQQRLRATMEIVKTHFPDMFLLPAFTNLYNDVPFYVPGDQGFFATPPGDNRDLLTREFFAEGYKRNYLPFVQQIVTAFRSEPQILAWEIGNELKLDRGNKADPGDPNPHLFVQFNLDVAANIKRWDPSHLVTTGMKSTHHAWLHTAALQEALYGSPNIDFITIHSYEGIWDQEGDRRVYDDAALAARLGKPFIVEEAGFDLRLFPDRAAKYEEHLNRWFDLGACGYMPWGFNHLREIGDGDHDVGVGADNPDYPHLFELFQRTSSAIERGVRAVAPAVMGRDGIGARGQARSLAGFDFARYNQTYLAPSSAGRVNDAASYGVRITPAAATPGGAYWKALGVRHLTPQENTGKRNVFVEILDESGRRVHDPSLQLQWGWEGQSGQEPSPPRTFDKGDHEPATNLDLYAGQHVWLRVGGGLPSDTVENLHTDHPDEPGPQGQLWNSRGHHSFYVVFQRARQAESVGAAPPVTAEPQPATSTPATPGPQPAIIPVTPTAPVTSAALNAAAKVGIDANAPIDTASGAIAPQVRDPEIIAATGAGWVRLNFILGRPWSDPQDTARPQGLTWAETYRQIVDGLRGRSLRIYGLISDEAVGEGVGDRFRDAPDDNPLDDPWLQRYANTFVTIARLFRDDIQVYESFNEPDDWHGQQRNWIHPGWYAALLEAVHNAVRSDASLRHLTLVSGPLQGLEGENKGNGARDYLDRAYQAGVALFGWGRAGKPFPFDGIGYHLYVHERYLPDPGVQEQAIRTTYRSYLDEMQNVVRRYEGRDKPVYVSEMGWFANGDPATMESFQAHSLQSGINCLVEEPSVALAINFCTQDFGRPEEGKFYGLYRQGALDASGRKRAFDAFQQTCAQPVQPGWLKHTPGVTPAAADGAAYLPGRDAIPDGTPMPPGQPFAQTWWMRNTGDRTWGPGYRIVWVGDKSLGARPEVPLPACAPGQEAPITVAFVAPGEPGRHRSTWQLCNAEDQLFGDPIWTEIEVTAMPTRGAPPQPVTGRGLAPTPPPLPSLPSLPGGVPPLPLPALPADLRGQDQVAVAAWLAIIHHTYWLRIAMLGGGMGDQQTVDDAAAAAIREIRQLLAWLDRDRR